MIDDDEKYLESDMFSIQKQRMDDVYPSENGIIYVPGKYYNKPRYFPYFDNLKKRGMFSHKVGCRYIFYIRDEDHALFPELDRMDYLEIEFNSPRNQEL